MHYILSSILLITIIIVINARLPSSSPTSMDNDNHSCPEEYRELRRRYDETTTDVDDDDDDDTHGDETRENVCEQAMGLIIKHRKNIATFNSRILLNYCPHYDERLALVKANNNTLCQNKKQELIDKQKQHENDQGHALHKKELKKRFALRFIRKRAV